MFPDHEPTIEVGIIEGSPHIDYRRLPDGTFELRRVSIGKGFHWAQEETQRFAGELIVLRRDGLETAVNRIGLEAYLQSVIASEMKATAPQEFLKASAIVSRSWLLANVLRGEKGNCKPDPESLTGCNFDNADAPERCFQSEKPLRTSPCPSPIFKEIERWEEREQHQDFNVCADDHCQRYQGVTRLELSAAPAQAVEATRGMVLAFDGDVCDARFSKCCGGRTETYDSCWDNLDIPYLVSVDDCDLVTGRPFCECQDPSLLAKVMNSYDLSLPHFAWEETFTAEELRQNILVRTGADVGPVEELIAMERGASGRIKHLKIIGSQGTLVLGKELEIRRALSPRCLRSSCFSVEKIAPAGREASGDKESLEAKESSQKMEKEPRFRLLGRGWGHGVGMCQVGAAVMASKGYTAQQILRHYFPLSSLEKIY